MYIITKQCLVLSGKVFNSVGLETTLALLLGGGREGGRVRDED